MKEEDPFDFEPVPIGETICGLIILIGLAIGLVLIAWFMPRPAHAFDRRQGQHILTLELPAKSYQ